MKKALSVSWTRLGLDPKLWARAGKAGRYMSIDSGPNAVNIPRTTVKRSPDAGLATDPVIRSVHPSASLRRQRRSGRSEWRGRGRGASSARGPEDRFLPSGEWVSMARPGPRSEQREDAGVGRHPQAYAAYAEDRPR